MGVTNRTHSTRPRSRLYLDIPRPDAPVIYTGAFPILTAQPSRRSIYNIYSSIFLLRFGHSSDRKGFIQLAFVGVQFRAQIQLDILKTSYHQLNNYNTPSESQHLHGWHIVKNEKKKKNLKNSPVNKNMNDKKLFNKIQRYYIVQNFGYTSIGLLQRKCYSFHKL